MYIFSVLCVCVWAPAQTPHFLYRINAPEWHLWQFVFANLCKALSQHKLYSTLWFAFQYGHGFRNSWQLPSREAIESARKTLRRRQFWNNLHRHWVTLFSLRFLYLNSHFFVSGVHFVVAGSCCCRLVWPRSSIICMQCRRLWQPGKFLPIWTIFSKWRFLSVNNLYIMWKCRCFVLHEGGNWCNSERRIEVPSQIRLYAVYWKNLLAGMKASVVRK